MSSNFPNSNCVKTSSNCIVWDGPDIPCLSLCKGTPVTAVLYQLAMKYCDILAPLSASYDVKCLNVADDTSLPDIVQALIYRICEIQVETGPEGPPGIAGLAGPPGNYVVVEPILAGSVCQCGGAKIIVKSGLGNAVVSESVVCNGCVGTPGTPGAPGNQGLPGLPGTKGDTGLPGQDGQDGADGADGQDGLDGADGIDGINGADGIDGEDGVDGEDGKSGRGLAAFIGGTEPDAARFTTEYGTAEGFGTNFLSGNNQIKPGDIWFVCS